MNDRASPRNYFEANTKPSHFSSTCSTSKTQLSSSRFNCNWAELKSVVRYAAQQLSPSVHPISVGAALPLRVLRNNSWGTCNVWHCVWEVKRRVLGVWGLSKSYFTLESSKFRFLSKHSQPFLQFIHLFWP